MIILALLGFGPIALAIGQISGQLVTVVAQFAATKYKLRLGFDRRLAAESARFCLPLAVANLLSWLLLSVDNVIVARVLTPLELGLYVLAFNISSWPMTAVGQAVRAVALPAFSRSETRDLRNRSLALGTEALWAVSLLLGVGLSTMAGSVIALLYGERWAGGSAALTGLALFGALRVIFDLFRHFPYSCWRNWDRSRPSDRLAYSDGSHYVRRRSFLRIIGRRMVTCACSDGCRAAGLCVLPSSRGRFRGTSSATMHAPHRVRNPDSDCLLVDRQSEPRSDHCDTSCRMRGAAALRSPTEPMVAS